MSPARVPDTPARGIAALPLTDPLVVSMDSGTRASEARPPLLALACRRACEALPGRHHAGRRRARRELATVVGFVAVLAVWRLGARAWLAGLAHARQGVDCR
eukprot:scaffold50268_cov28-Phaeocystis_antarctica.AAC.1